MGYGEFHSSAQLFYNNLDIHCVLCTSQHTFFKGIYALLGIKQNIITRLKVFFLPFKIKDNQVNKNVIEITFLYFSIYNL